MGTRANRLGKLSLLYTAFQALSWLVKAAGDVDFVVERVQDPGWIADVWVWFFVAPPWWLVLMTLLLAVVLLWRPSRGAEPEPVHRTREPPQTSDVSYAAHDDEVLLTDVIDGDFSGETVNLDGKHFINCHFGDACVVQWNGGDFRITNKTRGRSLRFTTENELIGKTIELTRSLGLLGVAHVSVLTSQSDGVHDPAGES